MSNSTEYLSFIRRESIDVTKAEHVPILLFAVFTQTLPKTEMFQCYKQEKKTGITGTFTPLSKIPIPETTGTAGYLGLEISPRKTKVGIWTETTNFTQIDGEDVYFAEPLLCFEGYTYTNSERQAYELVNSSKRMSILNNKEYLLKKWFSEEVMKLMNFVKILQQKDAP